MTGGDDLPFMRRALALADSRLGHTWPNPSVGVVIVKDGVIVGEGVTGDGGRPHGEEMALAGIGPAVRGATVYMVLEPCAKRSSTALSCTQRLLDAGVARAVVAAEDPHPNASGVGLAHLREAGVQVELGLCGAEARALNAGFFMRVTEHRPMVCADADRSRYDAVFNPPPGELPHVVLKRLASAGLTRMCVQPEGPLARQLDGEGLLSPVFRLKD